MFLKNLVVINVNQINATNNNNNEPQIDINE